MYDFEKDDDKNVLYKMFIAKQCNGCSTAPLTQYKNNEIYQQQKMIIQLIIQKTEFGLTWEEVRDILTN